MAPDIGQEITQAIRQPHRPSSPEQEPAHASLVGDRRVPLIPADDVQFIDFFIPHHQMAVEMAEIQIERGSDPEVKQMAEEMKEAQLEEIAKMRAARKELTGKADPPPPPHDPHVLFDERAMRSAKGDEVDRMFLEHMIPHHASGLPVAHRALANLQREDMRELAEEIIEAQATEIGQMKEMLGDSCPPSGGPVDCRNIAADTRIVGDLRIPYTPANDVRFIDFFVPHHRDAVEMAELVIEKGENEEVKGMAEQMREAQLREIEEMLAARKELTGEAEPPPPPEDPHNEKDMEAMEQLSGRALDLHFLESMIPHHASGLPAAHQGRPRLKREDLRELAREIFEAQSREIDELHAPLDQLE